MEEILKQQQELLGLEGSKQHSVEFLNNGTDKQDHQGETPGAVCVELPRLGVLV